MPYFVRFRFGWTSVSVALLAGPGIYVQRILWLDGARLAGWGFCFGRGPWPRFALWRISALTARQAWEANRTFWASPEKYEDDLP